MLPDYGYAIEVKFVSKIRSFLTSDKLLILSIFEGSGSQQNDGTPRGSCTIKRFAIGTFALRCRSFVFGIKKTAEM